jgi:hypothetical protein
LEEINAAINTLFFFSFDLRGEIQDPDGKIWANPGDNYVDEDSTYRAQLHTK